MKGNNAFHLSDEELNSEEMVIFRENVHKKKTDKCMTKNIHSINSKNK